MCNWTSRPLPSLSEISSSLYAPLGNFSCGVLAGVLASLVTQPADVVKTHVQVNPHLHKRTRDAVSFIFEVRKGAIFPPLVIRELCTPFVEALLSHYKSTFGRLMNCCSQNVLGNR